jgi:hypothetical protein
MMGALVGVVIGYVLGTRAGEKGYDELQVAWKTITSSEEVKDLASGGLSLARDLLRRGGGVLADRLQSAPGHSGLSQVA